MSTEQHIDPEPRFKAARKCDLDCACGSKGGERCKRKGVFNRPLPCGRDAELDQDPEGQEYAYRTCWMDDEEPGGEARLVAENEGYAERMRAKQVRLVGGDENVAWVERALLGTWERVER